MQWNAIGEQDCSMARTLAVIGDRWTLLILRECFLRVRRFDDFQERLGIGRPILTDRLRKLVDHFVLTKVAYQLNPTRYEYRLTPKGLDLYPVVLSIVHWGDVHLSGRKGRPVIHEHAAGTSSIPSRPVPPAPRRSTRATCGCCPGPACATRDDCRANAALPRNPNGCGRSAGHSEAGAWYSRVTSWARLARTARWLT
jgi:DNA-binding HxlR family transcriptional regulator